MIGGGKPDDQWAKLDATIEAPPCADPVAHHNLARKTF